MNFNRTEYPRPQFRRQKWQSLNGVWEFELDYEADGEKRRLQSSKVALAKKINVPFTYNYTASGLKDVEPCDVMWYRRTFSVQKHRSEHVLLCFNAVDYFSEVWVNGIHVCSHSGGYTPFSVDVTKFVKNGQNTVVVKCIDPDYADLPRGKQSWKGEPFSCWYVPNSGIWQSVWIEYCGEDFLAEFSATPDINKGCFFGSVKTNYGIADRLEISVFFNGEQIQKKLIKLKGRRAEYTVGLAKGKNSDDIHLWTPEEPNLYNIELKLKKGRKTVDFVQTRLGMRKISVDFHRQICLNNQKLYQRLVLDQGYWAQSGITPPSVEAIKNDIRLTKQMGFNGVRKHQKFEDPYFYYLADEMGLLVWCELPSAYEFCADEVFEQTKEWQGILSNVRNYASVIGYVLLNESWGVAQILNNSSQQNYARALYFLTKSLDSSRLISTNDGWENLDFTDVVTIHDYAFSGDGFNAKYATNCDTLIPSKRKLMAEGCSYGGEPLLFSEFGGIARQKNVGNGNWGYNTGANTDEEMLSRIDNLLNGIYSCDFQGFCYTQLTDVQQEVNGLLDENHEPKIEPALLAKLFGERKTD